MGSSEKYGTVGNPGAAGSYARVTYFVRIRPIIFPSPSRHHSPIPDNPTLSLPRCPTPMASVWRFTNTISVCKYFHDVSKFCSLTIRANLYVQCSYGEIQLYSSSKNYLFRECCSRHRIQQFSSQHLLQYRVESSVHLQILFADRSPQRG